MSETAQILSELQALRADLDKLATPPAGLIGYQGLQKLLAIDGKLPCLRTVKSLAARHRGVLRPVPLGHRTVGFRPARVEAFLAHLAGDQPAGGRQL